MKKSTSLVFLFLAPVIMASSCPRRDMPVGPGAALEPGNHRIALRHGGRNRSYMVHVPQSAGGPLPVLLAFHGGGGHAANFQSYSELDALSEREKFLVVYPNGTGVLAERLLTWNAGDGCCGYAATNRVDDIGFVVAVVQDLANRIPIAQDRIYATGHSNGGIFSHRLAAERPNFVAAIAPVAGALDLANFSPSAAVPVLQIHSVDDPRALYAGGLGPPFPGTNTRVLHQSVEAGINRWVSANGCSAAPDTGEVRVGATGTPNAGHTATLLIWRGCRSGAEVQHWKLTGSGHGWPGSVPPAGGEALVGPQTTIVTAAEEVWKFVSRFRTGVR